MTPTVDVDGLARLEEERHFLLRSLDDLERERAAGDIDDADYATLRDGYTARAAAVLRAIDAQRAVLPARRPVRWGRLAAIAVVLAAAAAVAGVAIARTSGQRLPGETVTGDLPDTVNSDLALGRSLFTRGEALPAVEAFDRVLAADPANTEALTYRGWLLALVGSQGGQDELVARGEASLDLALAAAPDYVDAQCFKAAVLFYVHQDPVAAGAPLTACTQAGPPPDLRRLVATLTADVAATGDGA